VDALLQQQPRAGDAGLARGGEDAEMAPLTASSRMQSSNTMLGDLPPSSSDTFLKVLAASSLTRAPVAVPPVKATLATLGCVTSGSPDHGAVAGDDVDHAGGTSAGSITSFMNSEQRAGGELGRLDDDRCSRPPAPGASFQPTSISGEFHGVMNAHTPTGSFKV
jgi:hypothetical protein